MIVPMKKVSLVVQNRNREESLKKLREVGVIHLEKKNVSSDALTKLLERKTRLENALGILRPLEVKGKPSKTELPSGVPVPGERDLAARVLELGEERKSLQEKAILLSKEQSRIEKWGGFDPDDLEFLRENGIVFYLYELSQSAFAALPSEVRYFVAARDKTITRLVVLDRELPGETLFLPGDQSLGEIHDLVVETGERLVEIDTGLRALLARKPVLEKELKGLLHRIEFETANSGMELLEDAPPELTVSWISGFVPVDGLGLLKRAAAENNWALLSADPGPDDMVPTKLKNNSLAKLLSPLTDFLEVVPGYSEVDISGWFLLFFTIFYGMIFGDAAYGAIFLIAGLIGVFKTAKKGVPAILKLLVLLGASNFIWGALTCTWFGVDVNLVPGFLRSVSLPLISNVTAAKSAADEGIVRQNLMIICFTLALLQLSIGHIIAITRCGNLKILGELGSIAMLAGMYGVVLSLIASNEYRQIPLLMPCVYALGGGFALNFVFVNYDGSIGRSVLEALKNFISMILGIANVFSDIMSYIRLWAVGLAGAAISSTVDSMAGPMLGHFVFFIFGVLLLVFGHGLNVVLNLLSVLVHGVRLNTLEFSSHVGLTWAGTAYKPFSEKGLSREEMSGSGS